MAALGPEPGRVAARRGRVAYEVLRISDRPQISGWLKPVMAPGLAVQRLTTRTPTDDQIEVAIVAVETALAGVRG